MLRPWRAGDAPAVVAAIDGDPEIARWLDQVPQPYSLDDAHAYIVSCRRGWEEGAGASFAVLDAAGGSLAGSVGIRLADLPIGVAELGRHFVAQAVEVLGRQRLVHLAPPDPVLRAGLLHEELVLRRAAGERAGVDDERAALGELPLAVQERLRVEQRGRRVPTNAPAWVQTVLVEADRSAQLSLGRRRHRSTHLRRRA